MSWEIFGIPQGATYGNLRENRVTVIGVSLDAGHQISDMRWKISEISLFRKNGVETPRYLLLKCFFGLHSPDMSLLS